MLAYPSGRGAAIGLRIRSDSVWLPRGRYMAIQVGSYVVVRALPAFAVRLAAPRAVDDERSIYMAAQSMRFTLPEVLSGMLASTDADSFIDDPVRLAATFEDLATRFSLFAPLATA